MSPMVTSSSSLSVKTQCKHVPTHLNDGHESRCVFINIHLGWRSLWDAQRQREASLEEDKDQGYKIK